MDDEKVEEGRVKAWFGAHWKGVCILVFPIIFSPIILKNNTPPYQCMYVFLTTAMLWVTEALPLPVSSMIPIFAFPLLDFMGSDKVCQLYFKDIMVMLLGSIGVALAIEFTNLHTRIALITIRCVGCSPRRLHLGVTLCTSFMSLWVANTAATAMMLPIVKAVIEQLAANGMCKEFTDETKNLPDADKKPSNFAAGFYLTTCYAASIGGVGTLIGTPPNMATKLLYESRFPESVESMAFPIYLMYALPPTIVMTFMLYFAIEFLFMGLLRPNSKDSSEIDFGNEAQEATKKVINQKWDELGGIKTGELTVLLLFSTMVALYFTRKPEIFHGWAENFDKKIGNSAPTVLIFLLLFSLPANYKFLKIGSKDKEVYVKTPECMTWKFIHERTPWGLIFLVGGGGVLAAGGNSSGMSKMLGDKLKVLGAMPPFIVLLISMTVVVLITNFTSNTAIANIVVPILMELAVNIKIHPLYLCLPICLSVSMAFMLPTGTPPNALVQSFANVPTKQMIYGGSLPSLGVVIIIFIFQLTYGKIVYPNLGSFPEWANQEPAAETAEGGFYRL